MVQRVRPKKQIRFRNRAPSPLAREAKTLRLALVQELQVLMIESMELLGASRSEQMMTYRRASTGVGANERPSLKLMKRIWALGNMLSTWRRDRPYLDAAGFPRVLPIRGKGVSLEALAKKFVPELSVDDVLAAITRHGEATLYRGDHVALVGASALQTPKTAEMMLALLVNRVRRVASTALHNASLPEGSKGRGRYERHVTGVLSEREFKAYAQVMRSQLQDICDRGEAGLELASDKKRRKRKTCGIGVFIFQDDD